MLKKYLRHPFCHLLTIVLLGALAYANSFNVPFVLDDLESIRHNEVIRTLGNFLPGGSAYDFLPRRIVGYFTFALNYQFGGLNVSGYHLLNLVIHLGTALLIYAFVQLTFRTPKLVESRLAPQVGTVALLAALFFVVHPVQTQAVTYIVQRLASLCTLFYMLSLVLYLAARLRFDAPAQHNSDKLNLTTGDWRAILLLAGAVAAALLAMGTKEIAFTLPLVVLFFEASFFRGAWQRRMMYLLPLLLTLPLLPFSLLTSDSTDPVTNDLEQQLRAHTDLPRSHYLFTQLRVIVTYLRLLILPIRQNIDYDYPVYTTFFTPPVFLSFLLLIALFSLALYLYRFKPGSFQKTEELRGEHRLIAFGIVWFFLTLTVESGFVPLADVIFEHRLYLPSIGLAISLAVLIILVTQQSASRLVARVALPMALLAIGLLTVVTWQRNQIWQSEITLWKDTVTKSPKKGRPWYNLGTSQIAANQPGDALQSLTQAVRNDPDYAEAWHNLGLAQLMIGDYQEALQPLRQAVRLDPELTDAEANLAIALIYTNQPRKAVVHLERIRQRFPERPNVRYNLGMAYLRVGNLTAARSELAALKRIDPDKALLLYGEISRMIKVP